MVRARSGDRLVVTLRSEEFDTYLQLGRLQGDAFQELASDDDGMDGVGTDSRLEFDVDEGGEYVIRATSFSPNATGAYHLEVETSGR